MNSFSIFRVSTGATCTSGFMRLIDRWIAVRSNGRLVVGGAFTAYNGQAANNIVSLHTGDTDGDGVQDAADTFPTNPATAVDADGDGLPDSWLQPNQYNCSSSATNCNGLELDTLVDSIDRDGVASASDNCPVNYNLDQLDTDGDGQGDACDTDKDNDGRLNYQDNCSLISNSDQFDADNDGIGDVCDSINLFVPAVVDSGFNVGTEMNGAVLALVTVCCNYRIMAIWIPHLILVLQ